MELRVQPGLNMGNVMVVLCALGGVDKTLLSIGYFVIHV
jgi:hypothetical protein